MKGLMKLSRILLILFIGVISCSNKERTKNTMNIDGANWAEKLGFPKGSRVVILHADDIGMCQEANQSAESYLLNNQIQSAAVMVPCQWFNDFSEWSIKHASFDVGLHLTLTAEWKTYRWGPISNVRDVPGLIDDDGYFYHEVPGVVMHASAEEVETEIRAQIDRAIESGMTPDHIDTHMGTLYGSAKYAKAFFKVAMEYNIPANVINFTPEIVKKFRKQGYPISDEMVSYGQDYTLPKLDDFYSVPTGKSYNDKKNNFYQLIQSLKPGLSEIIFHPSVETEGLKKITNSWQQRVWEAKMFSDPDIIQFMEDEGIVFTNWKEIMNRFEEKVKS